MFVRNLKYYLFASIKNPKKAIMKIRNYFQKAYIFIIRNESPFIHIEYKASNILNLNSLSRVPLIAIFSRSTQANAFAQTANLYIREKNKFVVQKGVAGYLKRINTQTKNVMFDNLTYTTEKKFILIDCYTLPKIEQVASVNYHFLVCLITNEDDKRELSKYKELLKFINILITTGYSPEPNSYNVPLLIQKKSTYEVLEALEFIISMQMNYDEAALIPLNLPAHYDERLTNENMRGLDAFFDLHYIDRSQSGSFQNFLVKNLNSKNVRQIYVNETIELLYKTMIDNCENIGNWSAFADRLLKDGYRIEVSQ